jgi:hypothetical protein
VIFTGKKKDGDDGVIHVSKKQVDEKRKPTMPAGWKGKSARKDE